MLDTQLIIQKTAQFIERELKNESSGHDWEHVKRVWINAKKIGCLEKADMLVIELAALLHDIDDWKLTGNTIGSDPIRARHFLESLSLSPNIVSTVCCIIQSIDYRGPDDHPKVRTLEEKVMFDADKLDALGAIGIARCFAFGGSKRRPIFLSDLKPAISLSSAEYVDMTRKENNSINHFFEKLLRLKDRMFTQAGKEEAQKRHDYMVNFLERFFEEQGQDEWLVLLGTFIRKQPC